ncbi:Protein CBR-TWK-16 [Dirofilaria immitis]|nr:Protein CBR-TWK-16 [Dirofilaria immitis]
MRTLGYNRIAPITTAGRMFSIIYGIFGIPITMIALSVTGRKLNAFVIKWKQKLMTCQIQNRKREGSLDSIENQKEPKEVEEISSGFATFIILTTFWLMWYLIDFINGFYYNFLCLTAIDFGQLIPQRRALIALLPITFTYVCFGLALATVAIDDGSKYATKLQHLGEKIKNVAATKIWFGGKTYNISGRVKMVQYQANVYVDTIESRRSIACSWQKCGIDSSVIDKLDLDNLIEEVIAINEGKVPAAATDDKIP